MALQAQLRLGANKPPLIWEIGSLHLLPLPLLPTRDTFCRRGKKKSHEEEEEEGACGRDDNNAQLRLSLSNWTCFFSLGFVCLFLLFLRLSSLLRPPPLSIPSSSPLKSCVLTSPSNVGAFGPPSPPPALEMCGINRFAINYTNFISTEIVFFFGGGCEDAAGGRFFGGITAGGSARASCILCIQFNSSSSVRALKKKDMSCFNL